MLRQRLETAWDIFMLVIAFLNITLILFDLTYISLRPFYIKYFPHIVSWYDPYKGIEPHWTTDRYRQFADSLYRYWRQGGRFTPSQLQEAGDTLYALSLKILSERPYERFGLMKYQELLKKKVKSFIHEHYNASLSSSEAFKRFWQLTPENAALHLDFYHRELRYLLLVNYYRQYDLSGDYVDLFWKLDLPFLIFFWVEFWGAWLVAIRTRRYAYWWMYPVAHWYDVLALIPLKSLRWFRLLRIWNLYLRLNRSKVINFSNTLIARFLSQQSRLIAKAISDEVAYQILEQVKRQAQRGEEIALAQEIIEDIRPLIRSVIAEEAAPVVATLRQTPALSQMIEDSLAHSLSSNLPSFPGVPKERLLEAARRIARQTTNKLLTDTEAYLRSPSGKRTLEELTDTILKHLSERLKSPDLKAQLQSAILTVITRLQRNFRQLPSSEG
ncbi:MAG: hypothetical protein N2253_00420 [Bacteroidia bacterium]|nr:hypothetical protein [Bacteroidia bacterium]MCX7763339.1 hypothetical protein [Bacteroidia bacterium]MDW8057782.1 hypothetical protein [Bacteroidia bacterium]